MTDFSHKPQPFGAKDAERYLNSQTPGARRASLEPSVQFPGPERRNGTRAVCVVPFCISGAVAGAFAAYLQVRLADKNNM